MTNFVLVHGSWFGGWSWDKTASLLREAGHEVCAPDLPGHGSDMSPVASCTLDAYVDRVCSTVQSLSGPVALVGHSMGGIVISGVAERIPEDISALVYLAAYLPRDGDSIRSIHMAAAVTDSLVRENMLPAADWSTVGFRAEGLRETFLGDCSDEDFLRASSLIRPEPAAAFNTPVRLTASRFGTVPRTYLRTTRDRALSPTLQNFMLSATSCARVMEIETGHCPMIEAPDRLNALFEAFSSEEKRVH